MMEPTLSLTEYPESTNKPLYYMGYGQTWINYNGAVVLQANSPDLGLLALHAHCI